ncbi:MAG: hypothetical protein CSA19_01955 [Deltaproteobacteria bacterium]|nr:MAG: hypothetical protein CSA19_01955 [Deltaproteobacteria bacterium]
MDVLKEQVLYEVAQSIKKLAYTYAPKRTHNLARDIQIFDEHIKQGWVEVGNSRLASYAVFVHSGTGIYGKHKRRIKPKNKKALRTPFGIFKSVKGQRANPYLQKALDHYTNSGALQKDLKRAQKLIAQEIKKKLLDHNLTSRA